MTSGLVGSSRTRAGLGNQPTAQAQSSRQSGEGKEPRTEKSSVSASLQ